MSDDANRWESIPDDRRRAGIRQRLTPSQASVNTWKPSAARWVRRAEFARAGLVPSGCI